VFVTELDDEKNFCRSRSICVTLVNLFVIEEDVQNEIHSFHSLNDNDALNAKTISNSLLAYKKDDNFLKRQHHRYQLHIIWAGWTLKGWDWTKISQLGSQIDSFQLSRPLLTILSRERQYCTTTEHCNDLQKKRGWVSGRKTETSIGDDLYNFLERLTDNRLLKFVGWSEPEFNNCFHISLISEMDLAKLEADDQEFKKSFFKAEPDVSKEQMSKSGSERKYALSLCIRKTEVRGKNKGTFSPNSLKSVPF